MGHNAQHIPPQQYAYGYPMHMPMVPVHQMNQPTPVGYYTHYQVPQMLPRIQAGTSTDKDKYQRSTTLRLGVGSKRIQQGNTPGGYQQYQTTQ